MATAQGSIAIAALEVGDSVAAVDPGTGDVAEHTVAAVMVHQDPEIEFLRIDGETIETTPDHPFLTDTGWIEAGALWPGRRSRDSTAGDDDGFDVGVLSLGAPRSDNSNVDQIPLSQVTR